MTDSSKVIEILKQIGEQIQMEKDFLTELDNVFGDGTMESIWPEDSKR